ncbi:Rv2175c family DNA-binding protein [Cellulomonas sp. C5510]|uniref:Rv2175c family DNA-binding protein n=1 Tax=Cellulomonas sp. C5510 TaxID=2871170 RepID=UPI001C95DF37|nr:Rv2175c family DNA-binding protein [Cellulomonas sp. C5510]QZN87138.1 DNA-binding protein [Cellulomonas sp. C5510]
MSPGLSTLARVTAQPTPDDLVDTWLTVPDAADELGVDAGKVRRLLKERRLAAVRRGQPPVLSIPAAFLVPVDAANPSADPHAADDEVPVPRAAVLASLQGTLTVLGDAGFSDEEALVWLFTADDSLPGRPVDALRAGHKTEVRRRAQAML